MINENKEPHYWRNTATKIALVLLTVVIIVWMLPRNESQQFKYDIGKPWMYGSFIAKFDFPVYKTDETVKREKDSLLRQFKPYYDFNVQIGQAAVQRFRNNFKNGIQGLPPEYVELIADRLEHLYMAGIVNTPEYNNIARDSTNEIRVIRGREVESTTISCIFSTMSAYEKLFMDEKIAAKRQILQNATSMTTLSRT